MLHLLALAAFAADPTEARRHDGEAVEPTPPPPASGFSFLGVVQNRMALTDIVTTNALLDGQIVGQLGGLNETTTRDRPLAWFSEQRVNGFFTYRPPILGERAALTAAFEVDFGFGDSAYATGGNRGGAIGADQVNLQTRRVHADFRVVDKPRHTLDLRLGLQFVSDGARDPATSRRDDLFRTGGGLRFFGSEAAGVTAFGTVRDASGVRARYKLGAYTLWEFGSGEVDDVTLYQADVELVPTWATRVGAHVWYVNDSSGGTGGLFGVGPTSLLSELQGGPKLSFVDLNGDPAAETNADVAWVAVDGGLNHDLGKGRLGVNGLVLANLGRLTVPGSGWISVLGLFADAEVRYRYGVGQGSVARLAASYASGDDPATEPYEGLITANAWGTVGAVYGSHGTVLLFPDITAINRQSAVVYDVSNGGAGLLSAQGAIGYDLVPNKVNASFTAAWAGDGGAPSLGAELNGRIEAVPLPFLTVALTGAGVLGTSFPVAPWAVYADLSWVVF